VQRNRARRVVREAFRRCVDLARGLDIVVMPRKGIGAVSGQDVERAYRSQVQRVRERLRAAGGKAAAVGD